MGAVRPMRRFGVVTIANGASLSDAYDIGENETLTGIILPAWTSAALTLTAGNPGTMTPAYNWGGPNGTTEFRDGLTYVGVVDESTDAEFAVAAATGGIYIAIDGTKLAGLQYIRVRSGTQAAPVVQAAERLITIVSTITG